MAKEDSFNAAMSACSMYGGLFKDVAQELGMEKALVLHTKQGEIFGSHFASTLKEQIGNKELDVKNFGSFMRGALDGFGLTYESEETPTSILFKNYRCPFYEGFKMAGIDHDTISSMCNRMAPAEYAEINKLFPKFQAQAKFRTSPNSYCTEEFMIKK